MKKIAYAPGVNNDLVIEMLKARNMDPSLVETLPHTGYIVVDGDTPVAMGFLRLVEGSYGMLDSYLTNPACSSKKRNKALDWITSDLIQHAKHINIAKLLVFSAEDTIIDRSIRHGFGSMPHKFTLLSFR